MTATETARPPTQPAAHRRRLIWGTVLRTLLGSLAVGGLTTLVASPWDLPVLRPAAVLALFAVPVLALTRRSTVAPVGVRRLVLSIGLVIVLLISAGLVLNAGLPYLGIQGPLARPYVAAAAGALALLATWWRPTKRPLVTWRESRAVVRGLLRLRFEPATTLAVAAVVVAVMGAIQLNNQSASLLPLIGRGLALVSFGILLTRRERPRLDAVVLYLVALSLLLSMSLRGWEIIGHDIKVEYLAYQLTQGDNHWVMARLPNAYNACLSINIWPTMLHNLTGIPGVWIFKVVLQLVFALTPIVVYSMARAVTRRRLGLVSAGIYMAFPTFFNDMPYLNRQELAMLFVGLCLMTALSAGVTVRDRRLCCSVLGAGVVVSHYSTTYVLLMTLATAAVVVLGARALGWLRRHPPRLRRRPHRRPRPRPATQPLVLASPLVIVLIVVLTGAWVGPATRSGGHLTETVTTTLTTLLQGDHVPGSSDLTYSLFSRHTTTPQQSLDHYVDTVQRAREKPPTTTQGAAPPGDLVVARPTTAELHPKALSPVAPPPTVVGRALQPLGLDLATTNSLLRAGCAALIQLWLLIGLAVCVVRWSRGRRFPGEALALMLGSLTGVALLVLIPSLSVDYGVLRAFEQSLLVTAPAVAMGARTMFVPLRGLAERATWVAVLGVMAVLMGLVIGVTGGAPSILSLTNSGQYYDLYYRKAPTFAATSWLRATLTRVGEEQGTRPTVQTDETGPLTTALLDRADVGSENYPLALRRGEWVFLNDPNITQRKSTLYLDGQLVTYSYPVEALRRRMDVVYAAPGAEVLK